MLTAIAAYEGTYEYWWEENTWDYCNCLHLLYYEFTPFSTKMSSRVPLHDRISANFKFKRMEESGPVLIWDICWEWLSNIRDAPATTARGLRVEVRTPYILNTRQEFCPPSILRSGFAQSWIWKRSVCSGTEFNSCGGHRRRPETDPSGVNPQTCDGTQMLNKHDDGLFYKLKATPSTSSLITVHPRVPCNYTPIHIFLNT